MLVYYDDDMLAGVFSNLFLKRDGNRKEKQIHFGGSVYISIIQT